MPFRHAVKLQNLFGLSLTVFGDSPCSARLFQVARRKKLLSDWAQIVLLGYHRNVYIRDADRCRLLRRKAQSCWFSSWLFVPATKGSREGPVLVGAVLDGMFQILAISCNLESGVRYTCNRCVLLSIVHSVPEEGELCL